MQKKTNKKKQYNWKEIAFANLPAAALLFFMAVALNVSLEYSLFLSFLILLVSYFVLGIAIEWILEKISIQQGAGTQHQRKYQAERARKLMHRFPDETQEKEEEERDQHAPRAFAGLYSHDPEEEEAIPHGLVRTRSKQDRKQPPIEERKPVRRHGQQDQKLIRTTSRFSDYEELTDSKATKANQGEYKAESVEEEPIVRSNRSTLLSQEEKDRALREYDLSYRPIKEAGSPQEATSVGEGKATEVPHELTAARKEDSFGQPEDQDIADIEELNRTSEAIVNEVSKRLDRRPSERLRDLRPANLSYEGTVKASQVAEEDLWLNQEETQSTEGASTLQEDSLDLNWRATPMSVPSDKVHADRNKVDDLFEEWEEEKPKKNTEKERSGLLGFLKKKEALNTTAMPSEATSSRKTTQKFSKKEEASAYAYPPLDLLKVGKRRQPEDIERLEAEQQRRGAKLIETLQSFGVGAKVIGITSGPAVTRFEIQPNSGVKVSKIVSLSDDIALNLASNGVRIEAPIPGKAAIGIEIPNREVDTVYLRDVIDSSEYRDASTKIPCALGKDIAGNVIIGDIAKMPHLLIAGSTGSGKSVCINTIIASILFKASPEEVRFIMVDPKVVELGIYNGIPHLLVPVVTHPKKAASAVAWAVGEVERRYALFAQYNVRDLKSYNLIDAKRKEPGQEKLPQIVIIIDELADLMMVASKDIEDSIIRLAQKARAAGVHLVIATQRPSVDVITGLIKANIPSRIAFAVTSQIDSRTILDGSGAEKLLGRGDMLYHPIGQAKPKRVQGAFVSDGEIEALVAHIKGQYGEAEYSQEVTECMENALKAPTPAAGKEENDESEEDALLQDAADLAFEFHQLSASFLQRKLKVGYSRAARLVDLLEERGLLSGADGSKPRQLLLTREEWDSRM